VILDADQPEIS
jgi:hypothetical protein